LKACVDYLYFRAKGPDLSGKLSTDGMTRHTGPRAVVVWMPYFTAPPVLADALRAMADGSRYVLPNTDCRYVR
jgi:hypothetical protein